jgi:N-acyl homoserine lactone hydrolase
MGARAGSEIPLADGGDRPVRHHASRRSAAEGRLVSIDGGREDVLPGVDLRAGHDTHTWGSQFVTIRNAAA